MAPDQRRDLEGDHFERLASERGVVRRQAAPAIWAIVARSCWEVPRVLVAEADLEPGAGVSRSRRILNQVKKSVEDGLEGPEGALSQP